MGELQAPRMVMGSDDARKNMPLVFCPYFNGDFFANPASSSVFSQGLIIGIYWNVPSSSRYGASIIFYPGGNHWQTSVGELEFQESLPDGSMGRSTILPM